MQGNGSKINKAFRRKGLLNIFWRQAIPIVPRVCDTEYQVPASKRPLFGAHVLLGSVYALKILAHVFCEVQPP